MSEFEIPPSGEARRLYEDEYLKNVVDDLEQGARDALLVVDPKDAARVARFQGQVAAYQTLRAKLMTLAEGTTTRAPRPPRA